MAVTPAGVELSDDRGQSFRRVLEAPAGAGFERPTVGWLPGHHLAVATRDGVATDACGE